jgi:type I restriction enzyme, S subunit
LPQDPNDKPASVLLDRIRAEREKTQKPEKVGKGRKKS